MIPQKLYDKIYNTVPRVCIDLIIKINNGVLLLRRDIPPYKGKWHLPGGGVKFGETIEETIDRILVGEVIKEEYNHIFKYEVVKEMGFMEFLNEKIQGNKRHTISIVFLIEGIEEKFLKGKVFSKCPNNIISVHKKFLTINKLIK